MLPALRPRVRAMQGPMPLIILNFAFYSNLSSKKIINEEQNEIDPVDPEDYSVYRLNGHSTLENGMNNLFLISHCIGLMPIATA